jgi:hypothetical protein
LQRRQETQHDESSVRHPLFAKSDLHPELLPIKIGSLDNLRDFGNTFHQVAPQFLNGVRNACSRPAVESLISRDHGRALRGENVSVTTIPPAASAF